MSPRCSSIAGRGEGGWAQPCSAPRKARRFGSGTHCSRWTPKQAATASGSTPGSAGSDSASAELRDVRRWHAAGSSDLLLPHALTLPVRLRTIDTRDLVCQMANLCHMVLHMENYHTLDAAFHALADPTRRAVVSRLTQGPASVKELAAPFDMGLPSFLKHLRVLEKDGLISSNKAGRVRTCRVNTESLAAAKSWLVRATCALAGQGGSACRLCRNSHVQEH